MTPRSQVTQRVSPDVVRSTSPPIPSPGHRVSVPLTVEIGPWRLILNVTGTNPELGHEMSPRVAWARLIVDRARGEWSKRSGRSDLESCDRSQPEGSAMVSGVQSEGALTGLQRAGVPPGMLTVYPVPNIESGTS